MIDNNNKIIFRFNLNSNEFNQSIAKSRELETDDNTGNCRRKYHKYIIFRK